MSEPVLFWAEDWKLTLYNPSAQRDIVDRNLLVKKGPMSISRILKAFDDNKRY